MKQPLGIIADRRRTVLGWGIALIAFASVGLLSSACIFDQGNYQGGGRLGQAATANQEKVGASSSSSSSGDDDDDTNSSSGTAALIEAGLIDAQ